MTESDEELRLEFEVECSAEHAFETWATKTSMWWPHDHSVSGDPEISVTFEPRRGGRIYERIAAGIEHDWGEIILWDPPYRLGYLWHIGRDRSAATEVEITFIATHAGTMVRISHRGWERVGEPGREMKERNRRGWAGLIPHYQKAFSRP